MYLKRIAALAAGVVLAGATATASSSAAANSPHPPTQPANVHLMVWSVNSDGPYFNALVTGGVGDHGQAVTVHPDGTVDPDHTSQLEMNLANGSFRLSFIPIAKSLAKVLQHWTPDPTTCSGSIRFTAPAPVIAGSGTGAYRGITGNFSMTVHMDEVIPNPPCLNIVAPLAELIVLDGTGTLSH